LKLAQDAFRAGETLIAQLGRGKLAGNQEAIDERRIFCRRMRPLDEVLAAKTQELGKTTAAAGCHIMAVGFEEIVTEIIAASGLKG
jgi:hypothetical protein